MEGAAAVALVEGAMFIIAATTVLIWNENTKPIEAPRTDVDTKPNLKVIGNKASNSPAKPIAK
ncbi:hypothetical protein [Paenibacillus sp. SYP-B4298]|uniref:hypothetical protein n=1 Tax=Paenibacillus sp. SYP-B4298 TaxID=2996034 RepID=UPI0022DCE8A2|nr:hypothetical protein [Paenibacillus sp. SYP-B4298]